MKLLDMMVQTNSLHEFVRQFIKIRNEEQEEKTIWEMWLHKVFDQSFADFKNRLTYGAKEETPKKEEIEATVMYSFNLLNGFAPDGVMKGDGIVSAAGNSSDRHAASGTGAD